MNFTTQFTTVKFDAFYKLLLLMADDIKALRSAATSEEICHALAQIGDNLHDVVLYDQYLKHGLIEVLRGK